MSLCPFSHPAFRGRFGVARRDTTPPVEIHSRNWGAAAHDVADAIHRPFLLTVITIQPEGGGEPFVMISLDLGWWRSKQELAVLSKAVTSAGIAPDHFLIALSHTHAGPIFCPALAKKPGGEWIEPYLQTLAVNLQEAVTEALATARPGYWEVASGTCGVTANRDLPDPVTGRLLVGWNPELEADGTLLVGRIADPLGRVLATTLNYACHPTILAWENRHLSPDFLGSLREVIEKETQAPCLFLQGASGELATREQYVGDPAIADRAGRAVGHAALGIFYTLLTPGQQLVYQGSVESGAPLAIWKSEPNENVPTGIQAISVDVELALRGGLATSEELRSQLAACEDRVVLEQLQRNLLRRVLVGDGSTVTRHHLLWRFGNILVVTVPDEAYSELQLSLRALAGEWPVFISTLTNGSVGYLSPKPSFAAKSYAATASPYAEGCFEQTLSTLKTELQKLL